MYIVKSGDDILYSESMAENGRTIISPIIEMELNKAASFKFVLPPDNPKIDSVQKLKKEITVWKNGTRIFRGRAIRTETDFYNQLTVYCESEIGYLNDILIRPYEATASVSDFFSYIIGKYNSGVASNRQFTVGTVNVTGATEKRSIKNYPSVLSVINDELIEKYGGYLIARYSGGVNYLDYKSDSGTDGTQKIMFGENLLDLSTDADDDDFYTVIVPLGKAKKDVKLTIKSQTVGGVDYLESANAAIYGRIEKVVEWSEIESAAALKTKAQAELAKVNEVTEVEVSALDLSILGTNVNELRLGDYYRLVSAPHGYVTDGDNNRFQLAKITLDLQRPDNCKYVFTKEYTSKKYDSVTRMTARNTTAIANNLATARGNLRQYEMDVTITADDITCDVTVEEFVWAVDNGKSLIGNDGTTQYSLRGDYSKSSGAYYCSITIVSTGVKYSKTNMNITDALVLDKED